MKKNNWWNSCTKFGIYAILAFCAFLFGNLTSVIAQNQFIPPAPNVDPTDPSSLETNPPFEIYGITCGKADTLQNKCCVNKPLIAIEALTNEGEMEALLTRIDAASSANVLSPGDIQLMTESAATYVQENGNSIFNGDAQIVSAAIQKLKNGENISSSEKSLLVKFVKSGFASNAVKAGIDEIFNKSITATGEGGLTDVDIEIIESALENHPLYKILHEKVDEWFVKFVDPTQAEPLSALDKERLKLFAQQGAARELDTTKDIGPARLMARQMFTPNKCIGASFAKVCFRGIAEFFAGLVDKTGITFALKDAYKQVGFTACEYGVPSGTPGDPSCVCQNPDGLAAICGRYLGSTSEAGRCSDCITNKGGFWTSLGCIGTDPSSFAQSLIGYGLSMGGAFSLLCIFYAAFVLQTSRGNPEKIKKAKENLRACITGLLVIIFSIFIVRLIGVDILRIPGFN